MTIHHFSTIKQYCQCYLAFNLYTKRGIVQRLLHRQYLICPPGRQWSHHKKLTMEQKRLFNFFFLVLLFKPHTRLKLNDIKGCRHAVKLFSRNNWYWKMYNHRSEENRLYKKKNEAIFSDTTNWLYAVKAMALI